MDASIEQTLASIEGMLANGCIGRRDTAAHRSLTAARVLVKFDTYPLYYVLQVKLPKLIHENFLIVGVSMNEHHTCAFNVHFCLFAHARSRSRSTVTSRCTQLLPYAALIGSVDWKPCQSRPQLLHNKQASCLHIRSLLHCHGRC